jgi:hypothetical protein
VRYLIVVGVAITSFGCAETSAPRPVALSIWDGPSEFGMHLMVSVQLRPRVVTANGDTVWVTPPPQLVSRNPEVVSVDGSNIITARAMGLTWIVAMLPGAPTLADSIRVSVVCTLELGSSFSPTEKTLDVGAHFTPAVTLWSCGGHLPLNDVFTWSAVDSTIVRVDPVSGLTTGLRPGRTFVLARGSRYGLFIGPQVTVALAAEGSR